MQICKFKWFLWNVIGKLWIHSFLQYMSTIVKEISWNHVCEVSSFLMSVCSLHFTIWNNTKQTNKLTYPLLSLWTADVSIYNFVSRDNFGSQFRQANIIIDMFYVVCTSAQPDTLQYKPHKYIYCSSHARNASQKLIKGAFS